MTASTCTPGSGSRPLCPAMMLVCAVMVGSLACDDTDEGGDDVADTPDCSMAPGAPDPCVPAEPCGAGLYPVGLELPAFIGPDRIEDLVLVRSRQAETERFASIGEVAGDRWLRVESPDEPVMFEIDFFAPTGREAGPDEAIFVEFRARLDGPGGPCQGRIELRLPGFGADAPDHREVAFCLGDGGFRPEGEPLGVDIAEPDTWHTYRLVYAAAAGQPTFTLSVDGGESASITPVQPVELDRDQIVPRQTFVRFGGVEGVSEWDYVRWGCVDEAGPCATDGAGPLDDDGAAADPTAACRAYRLPRGPCIGGRSPGGEVCDGRDNDCDGLVDERYRRGGADTAPALVFYDRPEEAAALGGEHDQLAQRLYLGDPCPIGDCRDARVACNPRYLDAPGEVPELTCDVQRDPAFRWDDVCDRTDNDCDGYIDELYRRFPGGLRPYPDSPGLLEDPSKRPLTVDGQPMFLGDRCGVGRCVEARVRCAVFGNPPRYQAECPTDEFALVERCGDRLDDDCDGTVDEHLPGLGVDRDGDAQPVCEHCRLWGRFAADNPVVVAAYPAEGWIDIASDDVIDDFVALLGAVPAGVDVLGADPPSPDALDLRVCFANPEDDPELREDPPPGYDCDDADATVRQGAAELCDLKDNDCDVAVDESDSTDPNGTPVNYACEQDARANQTEPVCSSDRDTACSSACRPGFDDRDDEPADCETAVNVDALAVCDDGRPNRAPFRDPRTGRDLRDRATGQLLGADGLPLVCGERCNGLDDDGDGQVDEARGMVLEPCYGGADDDARDTDEAACRAGAYACRDGTIDRSTCIGEVTPVAETCDGVDDDCDGTIDEGFIGLDTPIEQVPPALADAMDCTAVNPLSGPCRQATYRCVPGGPAAVPMRIPEGRTLATNPNDGTVCVPEVAPFTLFETCNGTDADGNILSLADHPEIDEDCDGEVDEEAGAVRQGPRRVYPFPTNCGACGISCIERGAALNSEQVCVAVGLVFQCSDDCAAGFVDADGDPANGCECAAQIPGARGSAVELCDDGAENSECADDCGEQDALAGMCPCGELGAGLIFGGVRTRCGEVCNGIDDDCDGLADETRSLLTPTCYSRSGDGTRGVGRCRAGRLACTDGELATRRAQSPDAVDLLDGRWGDEDADGCVDEITPVDEVPDGVDDDCDGRVDEGV